MKSHLCFPTAVTLDSLKMPSLSIYRTIDVSSDKNDFPTLLTVSRILQRISVRYSSTVPANIYLVKVKNRNTGRRCKICSKMTIKTPD